MPERSCPHPAVWALAGLFATSWIVAVQWMDSPGLLESSASWWRMAVQLPLHVALLYIWWQFGPAFRRPLTVAALWAVPLLVALPMHSRDAYSYAAQGWLLGHGLSPYEVPSGQAGEWGLLVGTHWFRTTSVYPSISLMLFQGVHAIFGSDIRCMILGLRLLNIAALVLLAWMLALLAKYYRIPRHTVWWLGITNPLMLVQGIGGVHNDVVMVALVAVALVLALRGGWGTLALAGVALGTAVGVKQAAALAGLGLVAIAWEARLRRGHRGWGALMATAVVPGITTVATFFGWTLLSGLGFGWRASTAGTPIAVASNAPMSWWGAFARGLDVERLDQLYSTLTDVSMLLIVVALVAMFVWFGPRADSPGKPWRFLVLSLLAFGFVGPALQPWYVMWVAPFFAFTRARGWWRYAWWGLLFAFTALPPLQDRMPPYVAMAVVAVPLVMLAVWWASRDRRLQRQTDEDQMA